ncbi:MAG: hypothetical protein J6A89_04640 [Clostridia bacterium]|nr:hypothetical protein [Clostridia bacterium]
MKSKYKILKIGGALLDSYQLENYLQKLAADQILKSKSDKITYPIPRVKENLKFISDVYNFLNEDLKNKIPIHPAGEWILDNFYIIEKNAKMIIKDLNIKKYVNFVGIANGPNKGFARVYVLAKEIISYTDGKINGENLEQYLRAYQNKKTLSMEELWSIGTFLQISLIEKIRIICEKIYLSQMQKRKVENIVSRLVEFNNNPVFKAPAVYNLKIEESVESKYPFIEYMSYRLKKYGKKAYSYLEILEEQVNKMGSTILDCINREHFDIAAKKISVGNAIMCINALNRLNFVEIFNNINGVEEVLKQDPAKIYDKMDYKTKEYYRSVIEKMSKKTKISELYIAQKCLELAENECKKNGTESKKSHVGYYLIYDGKNELYACLLNKKNKCTNKKIKAKFYIEGISILSIILSCIIGWYLNIKINQFFIPFLIFLLLIIPLKNIIIKIIQYISGKIVKPKLIPKLDFYNGIPEEYSTMVVIPTIVKNKEKVEEIMKKLEVFYMANKSENIYFTLLGDCSSSKKENEEFDDEVIKSGTELCEKLNNKYPDEKYPKFNFIYRKRTWNNSENCYLGWERKRGLLTQFNEYILGNSNNCFAANTFETAKTENKKIPNIKYIITLDSDTNLVLNTGLELIGAMAHILNRPVLNENKTLVIDGYGIMQPRVGIGLLEARKSIFTKIFSGLAGTDSYTNAISDFYYDNFAEGIFTGKGIYDLQIFSEVLKGEIPENTVLSHDLLEGCYVRCGLASDIVLMDGYPSSYNAYKTRLHRWIRGDYQILSWILKDRLNILSKYKIIDNINRSLSEICVVLLLFVNLLIQSKTVTTLAIVSIIIPYILDFINKVLYKKNGEFNQKKYSKEINGIGAIILKIIIDISLIPDKAFLSISAGVKSLYRIIKSKKHLLEWTTAEEAEKLSKSGVLPYYLNMVPNIILGAGIFTGGWYINNILYMLIGILWLISPIIMNYISKPITEKNKYEELNKEDQKYILEVGSRTWKFFKETITEEGNFLPPDNYQENRKQKVVFRTSSTNIGLGLLSVVASYDLGYEDKENTINLLEKMIRTIEKLQKWNGHLYNWYNTKTLEPLIPRYISSVDSGNFVGYLYVLKQFLIKENDNDEKFKPLINSVDNIINNTDFSKLFDEKNGLFSIGYNIEDNKMTDSYYDLLASEARQTSLVAIAKKDVSAKHWKNLSRTLTILNKYKGLISWSGTAFEYLMPSINIKRYPNSLLDESCKFLIMSQIEYAKKLGITWGISESAFNLKDFNGNYQYKAFGIPWLGLKRGLADEMVVSSYGTILAINDIPTQVIKNLKVLQESGMYDKYGFYESIDYTPSRVEKGKNFSVVKTYMAHHQGLILLSIDNLVKNNIFQDRFFENPEIEAVDILLQERMPDNVIITKEKKEKVEKIKYIDYDYYAERIFDKKNEDINEFNLISNNDYSILIDKNGNGYSKYKNKIINRYKETDDNNQGIYFFIKNIKSKKIWSSANLNYLDKSEKYTTSFFPDKSKFSRVDENIKTTVSVVIAPEDPVEIRKIDLKNIGNEDEILEVSSIIEPVISSASQDHAHKAFNNLFLSFEIQDGIIIAKRKFRDDSENDLYLAVGLYSEDSITGEMEYELDRKNLYGRQNFGIPNLIKNSKPFSKKVESTTNPIIAYRSSIEVKSNKNSSLSLIISASENKEEVIQNVKKYMNCENIERAINLSRAQIEAKIQYLGIHGKDVSLYQRILSHMLIKCGNKDLKIDENMIYKTSELWKFGISGDNLILLATVKDIAEIEIVENLVKAFEYYKIQNMPVDLVIINEEKESYENYVKDAISEIIGNHNLLNINSNGKIFVLNNISKQDKELLKIRANLMLLGSYGKIGLQLDEYDYEYSKTLKNIKYQKKNNYSDNIISANNNSNNKINFEGLKYFNEYGGFSNDGKEYIINVNKNEKLPLAWSHILANKKFGTVLTDGMGGYTWYKNSRLNRITSWSNDPVQDSQSEVIYLQDLENKNSWSISASPMPDNNEYYIKYGLGYAKYIHSNNNIDQEVEVFIPKDDSVKVNLIHLKNLLPQKRKVKLVYYTKMVLGEDDLINNGYIDLKFDSKSNTIIARNIINNDFKNYVYISSSEQIKSYTGSKKEFFGDGNLSNPDGVKISKFSNINSLNCDNIIALNIEIDLETLEHKDIALVIGAEDSIIDCKNMAYKYSKIDSCYREYDIVRRYWGNLINKLVVKTPNESMNIMVNGWLMYQTLCSRLLGRTGYYQSGGAFGFRDQLQDVMCLKYIDSEFTKNQIIKHSEHQFIEGDVLHWWHEETKRGIRTRFSDDLLWLPYVTADYIEFTNDYSILDIETNYLTGDLLENGVDERYDLYNASEIKEDIYNHCIRAIKKSCNFGEHGLPKIGSGDWNDGFSTVGNKGNGESVWLGFFLYDVFNKFINLCDYKKDEENKVYFMEVSEKLKKALNTEAWDGRWYKRAYCDDGNVLGTIHNQECRIDSIAQSWAVISNAGDNDKKYIAMESLENHLIDRNNGIIKLLDPPFENSNLNPGYIKAYLPGTRENGGQYTHAAIWTIIAESILGFGDKAVDLYKMINPIEHSKTKELSNKYKVEPYVIAADVYGASNLAGSGGWTWYTGSASWYYICAIKYILGLKIENGMLSMNPCISSDWSEYEIRYKFGESIYNIKVKNPNRKCSGVDKFYFNGNEISDKIIKLEDNRLVNEIEIIM